MTARRRDKSIQIVENLEVIDAGSEGNAVARWGDLVVFIPYAVPGDMLDVRIIRKKKSFAEGRIERIIKPSEQREEPFCSHFGVCGGCRWQHMRYDAQLTFKQKIVTDSLTRIARIPDPPVDPIIASPGITEYRNKLEFTFSALRWRTAGEEPVAEGSEDPGALGFHIPGFFDKVLDIRHCWLQKEPSNAIRNFLRDYAVAHQLSFYHIRRWEGLLRNLIVRNTAAGGLMVILVVREWLPGLTEPLLDALIGRFPVISSLYYVVNPKKNDSLTDLAFHHYHGDPFITEVFPPGRAGEPDVTYRIGPASFFQTNSRQAMNLYRIAAEMAGLSGRENVFDLYTGTGTIACYIARSAVRVTGIDSVAAAVEDARGNAVLNNLPNTQFFTGETETILTPEFIQQHGGCDVLISDPPRAGMHGKVIQAIHGAAPYRIVYISCNPATQARDIHLLSERYKLIRSQPVDMFPHTQHVENVVLMERKDTDTD